MTGVKIERVQMAPVFRVTGDFGVAEIYHWRDHVPPCSTRLMMRLNGVDTFYAGPKSLSAAVPGLTPDDRDMVRNEIAWLFQ